VTTLRALVEQGAARLARAGIEAPRKEARRLLAHALGVDPGRLAGMEHDAAPAEGAAAYLPMIERRAARAPLSHIVGYRDFWTHRFRVTTDVLDPRPETEKLVAAALEAPFARLLDLGTGSGCLATTLLAERPEATGVATDISAAALDVARDNAARLGVADRLAFVRADWAEGLAGPFDLIVSNPPYIPVGEIAGLAPEVRDHEPRGALTDGDDGLSAHARIAVAAPALLAPGGRLIVEIGPGQRDPVSELFAAAGLVVAGTRADMDGRVRAVLAKPA